MGKNRNGNKISVLDSSLRDGAQGEGVSFSIADKLSIVKNLDDLGVQYIEGGNPSSNPKDLEFFDELKKILCKKKLKHAEIVVFSSTHKIGVAAEDDEQLKILVQSGASICSIFGKCWDMHVAKVLNITLEENLKLISDTISYLKSCKMKVFFDCEHFFDGYKSNKEYTTKCLETAVNSGADMLVLCDTNGATFPNEIFDMTAEIVKKFTVEIGIHTHNDCGMAVANTVMAVLGGATHLQGTIGGIGERCGNADLCAVIPNLQLKKGYDIIGKNIAQLTHISRAICEICNIHLSNRRPYIGYAAFTHKGGMHADAVMKSPETYEHIDPQAVGNKRRIVTSEFSGRSALMPHINDVAPKLSRDSQTVKKILQGVKELEHEGYSFEGADASLEMLIKRETGQFKQHFKLESFKVMISEPFAEFSSSAMIKIGVNEESEFTAAEGDGPVNALDKALRKALEKFYPSINKMWLSDYKVRVLGSKDATASKVRVIITSTDGKKMWHTVGVSTDIIAASWKALLDSAEYYLNSL